MLYPPPFLLMTPEELALRSVRRGFWLRVARERANLSQGAAAKTLGLSGKSKSTLSAWENGSREPSPTKLEAMAQLYGVAVEVFMNPEPTAAERIDERLDELTRRASERESQEWAEAQARASAGGPAGARRRRSA